MQSQAFAIKNSSFNTQLFYTSHYFSTFIIDLMNTLCPQSTNAH